MTVLLGLGVFFLGAGFFGRSVAQARQGAWAGPRTSGMRQRAGQGGGSGAGHRPVRQEIKLLREKARLDNWLKHQEHERKNGTQASAGTPAAVTGPVLPPLQRARAAAQARFTRPPASSNGASPAAPAAPARAAGAPTQAPSRPAPSPGGNTPV